MSSLKIRQVLEQMQKAFFRVSEDGVLVYGDPFIGRLHHAASQLLVRWNRTLARIELVHRDACIETFALEPDPGDACRRACGAYWTALEHCFRTADLQCAAA